ncbi:MAG: phosphoadenosine phosphosulfate reductase, partial [Thermoprotei archaeon]
MYQLIVRAKKDSDALKAMARVFYPDWNLRISTLKGARGINEVRKNLEDMVDELLYNIILVGRE